MSTNHWFSKTYNSVSQSKINVILGKFLKSPFVFYIGKTVTVIVFCFEEDLAHIKIAKKKMICKIRIQQSNKN